MNACKSIFSQPKVSRESTITRGLVSGVLDQDFHIHTAEATLRARRAASCLLTPDKGDEVLLAVHETGDAHILAVLEQADASRAMLSAPGDMHIQARSVSVEGEAAVSVISPELDVHSVDARIGVGRLHYAGGEVDSDVETLKSKADSMERTARVAVERFGRVYRFVEGLEQACMGRFRQLVEGKWFVKGKKVTCNADETVNIDADEINLG